MSPASEFLSRQRKLAAFVSKSCKQIFPAQSDL
jgi:hypothetical protein